MLEVVSSSSSYRLDSSVVCAFSSGYIGVQQIRSPRYFAPCQRLHRLHTTTEAGLFGGRLVLTGTGMALGSLWSHLQGLGSQHPWFPILCQVSLKRCLRVRLIWEEARARRAWAPSRRRPGSCLEYGFRLAQPFPPQSVECFKSRTSAGRGGCCRCHRGGLRRPLGGGRG